MFSLLSRLRRPSRAEHDQKTASGKPYAAVPGLLAAALATTGDEPAEPDRDLLQQARHALESRIEADDPLGAVPELLGYVQQYPQVELFQVLVARCLEAAHKPDDSLIVWRGIHQRFPDSSDAFILMLRGVKRQLGVEAGRKEMELYFSGGSVAAKDILLEAKSWDELGDAEQAGTCFERLAQSHPAFETGYAAWSKSLLRRGHPWRARQVLEQGIEVLGDDARKLKRRLTELNGDLIALRRLGVDGEDRETPVSILVLEKLFEEIGRRRNAEYDPPDETFVGPVLMINGSLGAGGAERQFVNTAIALQSAIQEGRSIAGYPVLGPVQVVCRSLRSREGADFFAATLREAGIPVSVYSDMAEWGGCEVSSLLSPYRDYLRFLPRQIVEGTTKLTDVMRVSVPSVVHIWQDGSIFATALAALLAGVPRIVLSVRTMPPVDRPDRYRIEYDTIYRALLRMRGVALSSNSGFAAQRYADWLGLDARSIPVVYNGLAPLAATEDEACRRLWDAFAAGTPAGAYTIGTVMRVDDNKRPFLWVEAAHRYVQANPEARFVVVGGGPLLEPVKEFAQRLGLEGRVLFTGISRRVGFWLSHFDAFMLLSRFEGLPNVLIEAQFSGVPVVTTLAGGAGEAVREGVTGVTLPAGEIEASDVVRALEKVREMCRDDPDIGAAARNWATARFSLEQMIGATVNCYVNA
ncbi:MAG: glycosyltransferase [Castellaniella sp.]|uniref:glycosyltransferase n=1 Tax=Castellaniella sp. TaxID=1955812 RepID=UPI003C7086C2